MTDNDMRATVARMTADERAIGVRHVPAQLRGREKLLQRALAGDPNARFVIHTHWQRQQRADKTLS